MVEIVAEGAYSVDSDGLETWAKNPDAVFRPASTLKFITGYLAFLWVDDVDALLCEAIQSDKVGGTSARLQAGDVMTLRDMLYGLMLPSGNDAAHCIARTVGQVMLDSEGATGDPKARFIAEMNTTVAGWGWEGVNIGSPSGYPDSTSYITAKQLVDIGRHVYLAGSPIIEVAGTMHHESTVISGPNPRVIAYDNTFNRDGAVKFPEHIAGKTGSWTEGHGNLVCIWRHPDGTVHTTGILWSIPAAQRFVDMRRIMNEVIFGAVQSKITINGQRPVSMQCEEMQAVAMFLGTEDGQQTIWARQ